MLQGIIMKFSSLLGMASVAVLCFTAGTASASTAFTINLNGIGSFSDSQPATPSFTDYFTFTMPTSATNGFVHVTEGSSQVIFTSIKLFQGVIGFGDQVAIATNAAGITTLDIKAFELSQVGVNPYYLEVMGRALDGNPGYHGTISVGPVSVSPVPEPQTYAMLLAGLGLLAFTARRRKNSSF